MTSPGVLWSLTVVSLSAAAILDPNPRVLQVRWEERQLPPQLRSQALRNPRLRHALLYSSALHPGEKQVVSSEAERIPRSQIFNVLAHAGLLARHGRRVAPAAPAPRGRHQPPQLPFLYQDLQYL